MGCRVPDDTQNALAIFIDLQQTTLLLLQHGEVGTLIKDPQKMRDHNMFHCFYKGHYPEYYLLLYETHNTANQNGMGIIFLCVFFLGG